MCWNSSLMVVPDTRRLSVLRVTVKPSLRSSSIGCFSYETAAPVWRLEVGQTSSAIRLSRTYAARWPSVPSASDVVGDPHAVSDALGAAHLDRLVHRLGAHGLARVDGEVAVGPLQVLEGGQVLGRRVADLAARDVEARHPPVAVGDGELGYLQGAPGVPHAGEQRASVIRPSVRRSPSRKPSLTASTTSSRVRPASRCCSGA